ncbi:T9SS type B sorting domain-containing protein [Chryseobacterium luquanense]|uniref:T9SS type B sorting domain-containing protein n=1 Tax=Chryseobacterium luquanense TaxID=2983766 RepID=A0ABT3Y613_9FLAO|nr:T9SS type B sorting domain-containing protein [Chryseobacterium luquanense]MCX8533590.1 T9SS type B sorting domain-containing protein [Chryseobacterium luquanense]
MKKVLLLSFLFVLSIINQDLKAQTYQLTGSPVINTTGWDIVPSASATGDFVQLTADQTSQFGAIKLSNAINLKYCDKWKVEFDFRIDGNGTTAYGRGDGLTFWYLSNPPTAFTTGGGLGIPANANGLMVAFDIFNNSTEGQMSKVHVLYGTNNVPAGNPNIEYNMTANSTFHSADLNPTQPFVGANYKHVEVNGEIDPNNPNIWLIQIKIDGVMITNQSFTATGGAIGMTQGYFGFSAGTGAASARHSIKNAKIFIDKVPILQSTITPFVCTNPTTGNGFVNLTSYANQFVNNPANYIITYYVLGNPVPIANPTNFQYSAGTTTIQVVVKDPSSTLCDNGDGKIILNPTPFAAADVTMTACNNNNAGIAYYNLNNAALTTLPGVTKHYYHTLSDLNAGISEILNWANFPAAHGTTIHVQVTTAQGCVDNAIITLNHYPTVTVTNTTLRSCFIETNPSTGLFNLTTANVTTQAGTKQYYPSLTDAVNGTNNIPDPQNHIAPNGVVYIKVIDGNGCYAIAQVTLVVIPPVYSTVLKDKIICVEDKTTLDAGTGFSSYLWSTGATTQTISNVGVGTYWVKLKTGDCTSTQTVKVFASEQPVVTSIDVNATTITVYANGGTPAYQYSLDNVNWQESNIFKQLSRGIHKIYVKDSYDCEPMEVEVTVPNIINVITPNGDGLNDFIDYSALGSKIDLTFNVYDRYGTKLHQGDKTNNYRWDGTANGRKVPTGSYWYSVTWNENNKTKTPVKLAGWIMVKNRE